MNSTRKVKGLKGILASGLIGAAVGLASLLPATRAEAIPITIGTGTDNDTITEIQSIIDNPTYSDITWNSSSFQFSTNDFWNLAPNKNYIFNDVIISRATGSTPVRAFDIANGGDINISGNLTINDASIGFDIKETSYDNINISGVTFNVSKYGICMENRHLLTHVDERTASVLVSQCVANGGEKMIKYDPFTDVMNEFSPYAGAQNNTAMNLLNFMIDAPKADVSGQSIHILGNDEINNNVLINCEALSDPRDYWIYESPTYIAQNENVNNPIITGKIYYDRYNNPYVFDGQNCFVTSDMKFISETLGASGYLVPHYDSPLNLGDGKYIGAKAPEGVAFIENIDFKITPKNASHTIQKVPEFWFTFTGPNEHMFIQDGERWKLDAKYQVTLMNDVGRDGDPSNDEEIASATNHVIYSFPDEDSINAYKVTDPNDPNFGKYSLTGVWWGGPEFFMPEDTTWDIYAVMQNIEHSDYSIAQFAPVYSDTLLEVVSLPEPATLALAALGGAALLASRKRKSGLEDKVE